MTSIALITGANKGIGFATAQGHRARRRRCSGFRLPAKRDRPRGHARGLRNQRVRCRRGDKRANPGYCATDLNGRTGFRSPEQGAQVSVHLATLPDDRPTGQLWGYLWTGSGEEAHGILPW